MHGTVNTKLKITNTKFHGNPSSGSRAVSCRQEEWQDETNSSFLQSA